MSRTVLRAELSPAVIALTATPLLLLLLLLHREGDANALCGSYVNGYRQSLRAELIRGDFLARGSEQNAKQRRQRD